jgi:hypothetical protein
VWDQPMLHRVKIIELEKWLKREGGKPRDVALREKLRQTLYG